MVEAYSPQGERSGQQAHMCEQNTDWLLKTGQFLKDWRCFNQLPVCLRFLHLEKHKMKLEAQLWGNSRAPGKQKLVLVTVQRQMYQTISTSLHIDDCAGMRFEFELWILKTTLTNKKHLQPSHLILNKTPSLCSIIESNLILYSLLTEQCNNKHCNSFKFFSDLEATF